MIRRFAVTSHFFIWVLVLAMSLASVAAWQLWRSRDAIISNTAKINQNLLLVTSNALEQTLRATDYSLRQMAGELNALQDPTDISRLPQALLFGSYPQEGLGTYLVLDHEGKVMRSSRPLPEISQSFADRDYFTVHAKKHQQGIYFSPPFVSRLDNEASMAVSRAWQHSNGQFGGVVVQTLKINNLRRLFSQIDFGNRNGLSLFLQDGTVVVSFPYEGPVLNQSLAKNLNFQKALQSQSGTFVARSESSNIKRLYSYRNLAGYPFILITTQSVQTLMQDWYKNVWWLGSITLLFILISLFLARAAHKELLAHKATNERLIRTESSARVIMESLPAMVGYWSKSLTNLYSNAAHQRWFGLMPTEIHGKHLKDLISNEQFAALQPTLEAVWLGKTQTIDMAITDNTGNIGHVIATFIPDGPVGQITGFFALMSDITGRKAAEYKLYQEKERFRVTLESIGEAVITVDQLGNITYQNPAASTMTGWVLKQAIGKAIDDVVMLESSQNKRMVLAGVIRKALSRRRMVKISVEHDLISLAGQRHQVEESVAPIFDEQGQALGAVLVFQNVSQARADAHRMQHQAQHDALTGLPNRRLLEQLTRQAMARASRYSDRVGLLFLDLDGFKAVNDTYGHAVGDRLLVAVAQRFSETLRLEDTLCRLGGDEFVVLMHVIHDKSEARIVAERLVAACEQPFVVNEHNLSITVSIGISVFPDDVSDHDALISTADQAMYRAKEAGRNQYSFFDDN